MWDAESLVGIEVLGANLRNILSGFRSFQGLASSILLEEGLGTSTEDGRVLFQPDQWYPLPNFLRAFARIEAEFGAYTLRQVGASVPRNVPFPSWVRDIDTAIQSIDPVYHLNHARHGQPLFSSVTGKMEEGIGHYGYSRVPGRRHIISECTSPYPCAFDQGLLLAMARRFEPLAAVTHEPGSCRARGGDRCVYNVTWK